MPALGQWKQEDQYLRPVSTAWAVENLIWKKANYFRKVAVTPMKAALLGAFKSFLDQGCSSPWATSARRTGVSSPWLFLASLGPEELDTVMGPASAWHPLPPQKVMLGLSTLVTRILSPLLSVGPHCMSGWDLALLSGAILQVSSNFCSLHTQWLKWLVHVRTADTEVGTCSVQAGHTLSCIRAVWLTEL